MGSSTLLLLLIPMKSNLNFLWEILNESVKCTEYKYRDAGSWNTLPFGTTAAPSLQAFNSRPVRMEVSTLILSSPHSDLIAESAATFRVAMARLGAF